MIERNYKQFRRIILFWTKQWKKTILKSLCALSFDCFANESEQNERGEERREGDWLNHLIVIIIVIISLAFLFCFWFVFCCDCCKMSYDHSNTLLHVVKYLLSYSPFPRLSFQCSHLSSKHFLSISLICFCVFVFVNSVVLTRLSSSYDS